MLHTFLNGNTVCHPDSSLPFTQTMSVLSQSQSVPAMPLKRPPPPHPFQLSCHISSGWQPSFSTNKNRARTEMTLGIVKPGMVERKSNETLVQEKHSFGRECPCQQRPGSRCGNLPKVHSTSSPMRKWFPFQRLFSLNTRLQLYKKCLQKQSTKPCV